MLKRLLIYAALIAVTVTAIVLILSWSDSPANLYGDLDSSQITFKDQLETQPAPATNLQDLAFVDLSGQTVRLGDYQGRKHVVLVVTRGYAGSICIYCSTQTSRLVAQYSELAKRDAEVILVYPVKDKQDESRLGEFLAAVKKKLDAPLERLPFPVTLDTGLVAVDQLGIRRDLSKPATYILDKQGKVRFSYVGSSLADRPSVKALLSQLDGLQADEG